MLMDRFKMQGRVALVTGAGRGIGRGIALGLAEVGATVVCAARTEAQIEDTAQQARALGVEALAVPCDVTDQQQLEQLLQRTLEAYGRIDVLVNNAGGSLPGLTQATTPEAFEQAFHFNVGAAFTLSRLACATMLEQGSGAIVNISSAMAHLVDSGFVAYGTAKAALSHMTRLMAYEFAPKIRINALAVGAVQTDALAFVASTPALMDKMVALHPMGRVGTVEDVALAAIYLASDASSWVTGKVFEIDGGTVASSFPMTIKPF